LTISFGGNLYGSCARRRLTEKIRNKKQNKMLKFFLAGLAGMAFLLFVKMMEEEFLMESYKLEQKLIQQKY